MSLNAFVTLVTTDSYLPGALVTVHSVLEAEGNNPPYPFETVCLVTPSTVSVESIKALRRNFSLVVGVEELRSGSDVNLELLGRQDLASTLTKLQLFRLIQFRKIIFLDADTLCLKPLSHLFGSEAPFSAAPDSGWPDCFNSGMFVCTPSAETFDGLVQMASERGSWDGGDQGLLNDYFPDWNRVSFAYNVTPSAYYTYAPAYRRHGSGIKLVHFIGAHKPWHQAGPSRDQIASSTSTSDSDYQSLINKWYGVYYRHVTGRQAAHFTFPTLQAVWDSPLGHGKSSYTPPSLEDLKKTFQGASAGSSSGATRTFIGQQGGFEGHYVSMPLKPGRPDLLGNMVFIPRSQQAETERPLSPARAPSPAIAPPHLVAPVPQVLQTPTIAFHASSPDGQPSAPSAPMDRPWSPEQVTWDPARSEPPKDDRPQMAGGFNYHSENVWDEPRSSSSKRFFKAPDEYGAIPAVTHQNYSHVAHMSPDETRIKPIFPWEMNRALVPPPSRVFPVEHQRKPRLIPTRPAPPPPSSSGMTPSTSSNQVSSHTQHPSGHQHSYSAPHVAAPSSAAAVDFHNLSTAYTNAWDDVAGIRQYARDLRGDNRRGGSSSGARGGASHQRGSSTQSMPQQQQQQSSQSSASHSRSSSFQINTRAPNTADRGNSGSHAQRQSSSGSGYETGGEASSRDGDDEDDDEDEVDRRNAQARSTSRSNKSSYRPPPSNNGYAPSYTSSSSSQAGSLSASGATLRPSGIRQPSSRTSSSETITPSSSSPSVQAAPALYPGPVGVPGPSHSSYKPARVSRVFDPATATDVIRKEGLDALHRFVRSMEARGAAANGNGASNGQAGSHHGNGGPAPAAPGR